MGQLEDDAGWTVRISEALEKMFRVSCKNPYSPVETRFIPCIDYPRRFYLRCMTGVV